MTSIVFFAVVSLGFLAAFLFLGVKGRAAVSPNVSAVTALGQMIRLGGQRFTNSVRLLDDSEYRILAANPRLNRVAKQLLSSRRDLTLQWISVLLSDLNSLWRFRRLLVRHGAPVRPQEEFKILQTFVCCWALLFALKLSVRIAGPFAAAGLVRQAGGFVGSMSDAAASALARVPSAVWPEIERDWLAQAA
jgi:hypothetical protein